MVRSRRFAECLWSVDSDLIRVVRWLSLLVSFDWLPDKSVTGQTPKSEKRKTSLSEDQPLRQGSVSSGPSNCRDPRDATDRSGAVGDYCRWLQLGAVVDYVIKLFNANMQRSAEVLRRRSRNQNEVCPKTHLSAKDSGFNPCSICVSSVAESFLGFGHG